MTAPALFATFLHDAMSARRMPLDEFEDELGHVPREKIQSWLNGWSTPDLDQISMVSDALHRSPEEVAVAWLIAQRPELHPALYAEVLQPRGSKFPAPDDLAIRAPRPRKAPSRESMDVGDPHDIPASEWRMVTPAKGAARKHPPTRRSARERADDE